MYTIERNRLLFSNGPKLRQKGLFSTQIPRDGRLRLFRKKQTNSVMEDEKHVL